MAESLVTADGKPADVDAVADFAALMTGAANAADETTQVPPPPKKEPAPADPDAPYGRKADGTPRKSRGGRPPKQKPLDEPRVQAPTREQAPGLVKDYTQDLAEFTEGLWFLGAQFPATMADAAIFKIHRPRQVYAWNLAAQHNAYIRSGVEMICGKATWVGTLLMSTVPMVTQMVALRTGRMDAEAVAALVEMTKNDLEEMKAKYEQMAA